MASFSNFALRTGGPEGDYGLRNQEIMVPDGVHDAGDQVILQADGSTFSTTFIGYEADTFHPIFQSDGTNQYIIATNGKEGNIHTVPVGGIVPDTPLELGFARFDNVAIRQGDGDYMFLGESRDIPSRTYEVGDTATIRFDNQDFVSEFVGFEAATNYLVFRSVAGSNGEAMDFILTDEPSGSISYMPGEIITDPYMNCFAPGTLIATPDGERPVETLAPGDVVLTADGGVETVKWVGFQKVSTRFGPPEVTQPVRIMAGALDDNVPHTDLVVTKDHGMILDGVIFQAGALINGTSIVEVPTRELGKVATWYHVETENHVPLLANGAAAESFIDNVDRARFGNHSEFVALYGSNVPAMTEMNLPRAMSARQVPKRITSLLATRAAMILGPVAEGPAARRA